MSRKYAFIGDIHGELGRLANVVERAQGVADFIVFLGDYVNRGSQSRQVLDFLVDLAESRPSDVHFLSGHHDVAFLNALTGNQLDTFLRMGGAATLQSYPRENERGEPLSLLQRVPASHLAFLRNLRPTFTEDGFIAMHDQTDVPESCDQMFGIFGHRVQSSTEPTVTDDFALIDTGCGTLPEGRLTCFLWPDRTWFQA